MKQDIVLVQVPNKTIEIPPLGTAVLKSSIQKENYLCKQYDLNVILKDCLIKKENMSYLYNKVLPYLLSKNINNFTIAKNIEAFLTLLEHIDKKFTFDRLCYVKELLQKRNFEDVFCDKINAKVYTLLIKLISLSNTFFNLVTTDNQLEKLFPKLFVFDIIDNTIQEIIKSNPYLLGFSIVEMQRQFSLWTINRIRTKFDYKGTIVVGGSDITYFKEKYLQNFSQIDYAIYQEGEYTIVELLKFIKGEINTCKNISNLIYREGQEVVITKSKCVENFTEYIPDFDDLPLEKYITDALPVQASRGCSWAKCTYCKHFKTYGKDYYHGKPQEIVEHIRALQIRYNTKLFHFVDDDFPLELKNKVVDEINCKGLKIIWLAYSRFDKKITKEMLEKWYRSGLYVIEWGLESASDSVLKRVKKGTQISTIKRLLWESYSVGMLSKLFMFHNLPGETYEDIWSSVQFLKTYVDQGIVRPFWEILTPLELLVGTPLYIESLQQKSKTENTFSKVFSPRGELVVQAGYIPKEKYEIKKTILTDNIAELKERCNKENILEMNDEAIMIDVILEKLRYENKPLQVKARF